MFSKITHLKGVFGQNTKRLKILKLPQDFRYSQKLAQVLHQTSRFESCGS